MPTLRWACELKFDAGFPIGDGHSNKVGLTEASHRRVGVLFELVAAILALAPVRRGEGRVRGCPAFDDPV